MARFSFSQEWLEARLVFVSESIPDLVHFHLNRLNLCLKSLLPLLPSLGQAFLPCAASMRLGFGERTHTKRASERACDVHWVVQLAM